MPQSSNPLSAFNFFGVHPGKNFSLLIFTDQRTRFFRDGLREQHQLSQEIAAAITNNPLGEQPDEDELEAELEGLEQEAMDERMLKTGTVPVSDQLNRLPAAANGEREYIHPVYIRLETD